MKKKNYRNSWRKLDNTAKIFSMEDYTNNNTFRLSVVLKEKINPSYLKDAVIRTLMEYPSYKVKIRVGFFWNYFEKNDNDVIMVSGFSVNLLENIFDLENFNPLDQMIQVLGKYILLLNEER